MDTKISEVPIAIEVARDYAGRFWSAGNAITTLMFGLAFSVYLAAAQGPEVRLLIQRFYELLLILALVGNGALLFIIHRAYLRETQLLAVATGTDELKEYSRAGYRIRVGLFAFNFLFYVAVITLIWQLTEPVKMPPSSPDIAALDSVRSLESDGVWSQFLR